MRTPAIPTRKSTRLMLITDEKYDLNNLRYKILFSLFAICVR